MSEPHQPAEDLPPPTPELVLLRAFAEAFLLSRPKKEAQVFLRLAEEILRRSVPPPGVTPIHVSSAHLRARRQACNWFDRIVGVHRARLE